MQTINEQQSFRNRIRDIQIRLMSSDLFAKDDLCDEYLRIVEELDEKESETKAELKAWAIPFLIDINRIDEALHIIGYLQKQSHYRFHLHAFIMQAEIAKRRNDWRGYVEAIDKGLGVAKIHENIGALSQGYVMRAKGFLKLEKYQCALEDLNSAIPYAEKSSDFNLIAVAKYYIGIILMAMEHSELAMEKFREASEMAHEQKCSDIAKHVEVVRALYLLKMGETKAAEGLLETWYREFCFVL